MILEANYLSLVVRIPEVFITTPNYCYVQDKSLKMSSVYYSLLLINAVSVPLIITP